MTVLPSAGKARRFRLPLRAVLPLFLLLALVPAAAGEAPPAGEVAPPVVTLDTDRETIEDLPAWAWVGPAAQASLEEVAAGRLPMRPLRSGRALRVREGISVWARLRLQPTRGEGAHWHLELPLPNVDRASVHWRDGKGQWRTRSAGDTVARSQWPQAGRFPVFHLELPEGRPTDVFVHVEHSTPLALPLRLATTGAHFSRSLLEYLGLGMVLGALALLVLVNVVQARRLRDPAHGWCAAYGVVSMLALASFTGVAGHLFWGEAAAWTDVAPGFLTLLAGGMAMLIVGKLSGVVTRTVWLGGSVQIVGWSGLLFAPLYLFVDRLDGLLMMGAYLVGVSALSLHAAAATWRRGDPVGRWMLWGSLPLAGAVIVAVLRSLGMVPAFWLTEYAVALALTITLPMLLAALESRSQERRGAELRQLASEHQDALTGLLKARPFVARLAQALHRHHRRGEGAAVALIELSNYAWIKQTFGVEVAEESLLRTVIKLRRLVRDIDTTGRIGENRFGLILEGVSLPRPVSGVASRLIAAGLMEEPGRPSEVQLRLHIAAVLLKDHAPAAEQLLADLHRVLEAMSPRTARPFRFLDPAELGPADPLDVPLEPMLLKEPAINDS